MRPDAKAEVLGALREVYDGETGAAAPRAAVSFIGKARSASSSAALP